MNDCVISVTLQDLQRLEEEVRGQRLPRPHLLALEVTRHPSDRRYYKEVRARL